jgi:hypothetical protein
MHSKVGCAVGELPVNQVFLQLSSVFPCLMITLPLLHTYPSLSQVCSSPDQAAYCHILGPKVGSLISAPALGWLQSEKVSNVSKLVRYYFPKLLSRD